jgi:ABC-type branched-subunit amino acid transport system substrate-binding protein
MFQLARRRRHLVLAAAAAACLVALSSCSSGESDAGGIASSPGILLCGTDVYNVPMIKALRQAGYQGHLYSQSTGVLPAEAASLGALGDGVRLSFVSQPASNTSDPIVAQMVASVNKYEPGTPLDETAAAGWSGVYLFAHVMAKESRANLMPSDGRDAACAVTGCKQHPTVVR